MIFRFYSKNENNRNERITLVGEHVEGVLKIAAARCSKRDQFQRSKGAKIALGRLAKNKLAYAIPMVTCTGTDFVSVAQTLIEPILQSKQILMVVKTEQVLPAGE